MALSLLSLGGESMYRRTAGLAAHGLPRSNPILYVFGRSSFFGFFGDGGPATRAIFNTMTYAAPDDAGGFIIVDANNGAVR